MFRKFHFKDDGQDIQWWIVDGNGVVQFCNMQEWVWKGTEVLCAFGNDHNTLESIQAGDTLYCKFTEISPGQFIHPVIKVEELAGDLKSISRALNKERKSHLENSRRNREKNSRDRS